MTINSFGKELSVEQDMAILNEGDAAPYDGVLVPEWAYNELSDSLSESGQFEVELRKCLDEQKKSEDSPSPIQTFLNGALAGGLVVFLFTFIKR